MEEEQFLEEAEQFLGEEEEEFHEEEINLLKCERQCIHQGDRICYNDIGDKEIIKKIPEDGDSLENSTSSASSVTLDSLHSGESLFKTFTFEGEDNPDMKKCMAFWKSILEKNIKPVKCTLLKRKSGKKTSDKETSTPEVKKKEELDPNIWMDLCKDLQKKKLDQVKLVRGKTCDPCGEYAEDDKMEQEEEIKKLNNWASKSNKLARINIKDQVNRTARILKGKRSFDNTTAVEDPKFGMMGDKSDPHSLENKLLESEMTENEEIIEEDLANVSQVSVCCDCGCELQECCCNKQCRSDDEQNICCNEVCTCGCGLKECICTKEGNDCSCSCGLKECICDDGDQEKGGCQCGCGLEDCICKELYTKSCKCGHADCDCDIIGILSTYMETLTTPLKGTRRKIEGDDAAPGECLNKETQLGEEGLWPMPVPREEGHYCVICGHFNCFCKVKS